VVVAKWTRELDAKRLEHQLSGETLRDAQEPEAVIDQMAERLPSVS
jgi:hypothetical protein